MIRRAALVLAVIAAFGLVAFGRGAGDDEPSRASSNAPAITAPQEDPYVAWWKFATTSSDSDMDISTEDPYVAWWKFATTSQDVVRPD